MLRAVGSCCLPKPAPPLSCFENKTTSGWVFLLGWQATSAQFNATGSTGLHGTSSRSYHTHISNTKLLFIDLVGNSDLTLHTNYKFGSISETKNGCIFTATLAPPFLLLSLLKTCQEYIDKQCRPKRDAAEISIYYLY